MGLNIKVCFKTKTENYKQRRCPIKLTLVTIAIDLADS